MHIEFIDLLRCPRDHEQSWLVAAFYRMEGRTVIDARLGCHVCGAEYVIREGAAFFDEGEADPHLSPLTGRRFRDDERDAQTEAEREAGSTRIAAFLNLTRPGTLALLTGKWARSAEAVAELANSRILALNPDSLAGGSDSVAEIHASGRVPLAEHSLDGVALDELHSTPFMFGEAARLLRLGGRLAAAGAAKLPPQFRELARDVNDVVAEYAGDLVALRR